MHTYELRYVFDYGSGMCLWSSNEAAREKYGYPVDLEALDVPTDIKALGHELVREYDTSLNWDYPPDPSPWSVQHWSDFGLRSGQFLARLREYLGPQFIVIDECKVLGNG